MTDAHSVDPIIARAIIHDLADGVVPPQGFEFFSNGREKWLDSLRLDMDDLASQLSSGSRLRLINGRNGDGKTHLMHLLRNLALQSNFAVAYVVISEDVPLNQWNRIYHQIATDITLPSGVTGIRDIFDPASPAPEIAKDFQAKAAALRSLRAIDPDFLTALYRYTTRQTVNVDVGQDMHQLASWLEGHPTAGMRAFGITTLIDRRNGAAVLRSLVRALRYFGVPGVLIMIDEVESILALNSRQRRDCYQTLRLIVDGTSTPEHSLVVASTTPSMYSDVEEGLPTYPALWSRIRADQDSGAVNYHGTLIDLTRTPLTSTDYMAIAKAITNIFAVAWSSRNYWDVLEPFAREAATMAAGGRLTMTFSPTRVFVKLIVDVLTALRDEQTTDASAAGSIPGAYRDLAGAFGSVDAKLSSEVAEN